jgi:hypothetical protein
MNNNKSRRLLLLNELERTIMNTEQLKRMHEGKASSQHWIRAAGYPKALLHYGIKEDAYSNDKEMFDLVQRCGRALSPAPPLPRNTFSAPSYSKTP